MEKLTVIDDENSDILSVGSTILDSVSLVERLISMTVATILYLRKILPNSEFDDKVLGGMTLKVLKNDTDNSDVQKIAMWLSGAFDALREKYLKRISLEITDFRNHVTLEIYTFTIFYDAVSNTFLNFSLSSPNNRRSIFGEEFISDFQFQTLKLLQMCHTAAKYSSELPGEFAVLMKLSYHENTPTHYQPCGYKDYGSEIPPFPKKTRKIGLGATNTGYHFISFATKSCLLDESTLPKPGKDKTLHKAGDVSSQHSSSPKQWKLQYNAGQDTSSFSLKRDFKISEKENKQNSSQCTDDASQSDLVRCPCLSQIKTSLMYQCSGCHYWVHAECFGINHDKNLVKIDKFYCQLCHKLIKDYECCDKFMAKLDSAIDQQKLAVQRRLLRFCSRMDEQEISFRKFEKVSGLSFQQTLVHSILKKMTKEGVLNEVSRDIYLLNRTKVTQKLADLFSVRSTSQDINPEKNSKEEIINVTPELKKRKLKERNDSESKVLKTQRTKTGRGNKIFS